MAQFMPTLDQSRTGPDARPDVEALIEKTRLFTAKKELAPQKGAVRLPPRHLPGYTGYIPNNQYAFGMTFGSTCDLGLQKARTPRGHEPGYQYFNTTSGATNREVKQEIPCVPGPGYTGYMECLQMHQGSQMEIDAFYRAVAEEMRQVKEAYAAHGKKVVLKNRVRNSSNIKWGDTFVWAGPHMFYSTYEDTFIDEEKRQTYLHQVGKDDRDMHNAIRQQEYMVAKMVCTPERVRHLRYQLRAKLQERTSCGQREIYNKFKALDRNNSGGVDMYEFTQVLEWFGMKIGKREVIALFGEYDLDGDGTVTYQEFLTAIQQNLDELPLF
jgi:hypothetical protein